MAISQPTVVHVFRCEDGEAKISCGYRLPARYVISTVGPIGEHPKVQTNPLIGSFASNSKQVLENAYLNSLKVMKENNLRSIAFPCISTGIYGYPSVSLFCKGEKVKDLLGSKSESGRLQELSGVRLHGGPAHGQILPGEKQGFC